MPLRIFREWRRPRCSCHPRRDRPHGGGLCKAELGRDAQLISELDPKGAAECEFASLEEDEGDRERDLVRRPRRGGRRPCAWLPSRVQRRRGTFTALVSRDDSPRRRMPPRCWRRRPSRPKGRCPVSPQLGKA